MPVAAIRGADIAYDLTGPEDGPCITLVHSLGLSTREGWRAQVPVLERRGYRVLAYDIRGLGDSSLGNDRIGIDTFTSDLVALLDHLGIDETALMGISLGGFIGQSFALGYGDRLTALILVSTACRVPGGNTGRRRSRIRLIRERGMAAAVEGQIESHFPAAFIKENQDVIEWYRRHYVANDPETYIAILEALGRFDTRGRIERITPQTLVVAGGADTSPIAGSQPAETGYDLAGRIPGGRFALISGAGHYPHIDHEREFNQVMTEFLDEVASA